jgi:flagellar protein FliS
MAAKGIYISKAQDIIDELNNSLNMQDGGEIALTLRKIYNFLYFYLVKANLKKDPKMIKEVISILSTLREAWDEISKKKIEEDKSEEKVELASTIKA